MLLKNRKNLYILFLIISTITIFSNNVYAIEECQRIQSPKDLPCNIISTWVYSSPCNSHYALIYLDNGTLIDNRTYSDHGNTSLCKFEWNITTQASYNYIVDTTETGNIIIKKMVGIDDRMMSITLTILGLAIFFIFMGIINKLTPLKYGFFAMASIQVILILGINYIEELNGSIINLLKIDFYLLGILFIGMAIYSMIMKSIGLVDISNTDEDNNKWNNKSKWV